MCQYHVPMMYYTCAQYIKIHEFYNRLPLQRTYTMICSRSASILPFNRLIFHSTSSLCCLQRFADVGAFVLFLWLVQWPRPEGAIVRRIINAGTLISSQRRWTFYAFKNIWSQLWRFHLWIISGMCFTVSGSLMWYQRTNLPSICAALFTD